jgi:hypothetical protein
MHPLQAMGYVRDRVIIQFSTVFGKFLSHYKLLLFDEIKANGNHFFTRMRLKSISVLCNVRSKPEIPYNISRSKCNLHGMVRRQNKKVVAMGENCAKRPIAIWE